MAAIRCICGVYIKEPQRRCKRCAVQYLTQFDTDYLDRIPDEPTQQLPAGWESDPMKSGVRSRAFSDNIKNQLRWRKGVAIVLWLLLMLFVVGVAVVLALVGNSH